MSKVKLLREEQIFKNRIKDDLRYLLALDVSLKETGYSVYDLHEGKYIEYGTIETDEERPIGYRLGTFNRDLNNIAYKYKYKMAVVREAQNFSFGGRSTKGDSNVSKVNGIVDLIFPESIEMSSGDVTTHLLKPRGISPVNSIGECSKLLNSREIKLAKKGIKKGIINRSYRKKILVHRLIEDIYKVNINSLDTSDAMGICHTFRNGKYNFFVNSIIKDYERKMKKEKSKKTRIRKKYIEDCQTNIDIFRDVLI